MANNNSYLTLMGHKIVKRHGPTTVFYGIFCMLMVFVPISIILITWAKYTSTSIPTGVNITGFDIVKYSVGAIQYLMTKNENYLLESIYGATILKDITQYCANGAIHYVVLIAPLITCFSLIITIVFGVLSFVYGLVCICKGKLSSFRAPSIFGAFTMAFAIVSSFMPLLVFLMFKMFFKSDAATYSFDGWYFGFIIAAGAIVIQIVISSIFDYGLDGHILIDSEKDIAEFEKDLKKNGEQNKIDPSEINSKKFHQQALYAGSNAPSITADLNKNDFIKERDAAYSKNENSYPDYDLVNTRRYYDLNVKKISVKNGLPLDVKSLGGHSYSQNLVLYTAIIPEGIKYIGIGAFSNCLNLKLVSLPKSLRKIDANAFFNCRRLERIYYNGTKKEWRRIARGSYWLEKVPTKIVICVDGAVIVNPYR